MSPGILALSLRAAESLPSAEEMKKLTWLFGCPLLPGDVAQESWLRSDSSDLLLEVGPRQVSQPRAIHSMFSGIPPLQAHCPPLLLPFLSFLPSRSLADLYFLRSVLLPARNATPRPESH